MSSHKQQPFEIAPSDEIEVGTEILDPNLPSNLDFDQKQPQQIEMSEIKKGQSQEISLGKIDLENYSIKSYIVKGKVVFNLEPQYKLGSYMQPNTPTFRVKSFNDEFSGGLKRIWETVVGYTNRQLFINQGFIYLLDRQKQGLLIINHWKLVNIFKIFLDYEESRVRLVIKQEGTEHLQMKDYQSVQIKLLLETLSQQINSIGLSLVG